jgi:hypothetical protein
MPSDRMKVVGRRDTGRFSWDDVSRLVDTSEALRGTSSLVPRGVYRYASFEEADRWMTRTIALTHARLGRRTSPASAAR